MRVMVIDDGVNEGFIGIDSLFVNIEIDNDLMIKQRIGYDKFIDSHGSICSKIILNYYPELELGSIKILDDIEKTSVVEKLLIALRYCLTLEINVIHLSLGTQNIEYFQSLYYVISVLSRKGIIIVCACNQNDELSLPSFFPNVIGVGTDHIMYGNQLLINDFCFIGKDIVAPSVHRLFGNIYTECYTSYAASFVTAKVCHILKKNRTDICGIKDLLNIRSYCSVPPLLQKPLVICGEKYNVIRLNNMEKINVLEDKNVILDRIEDIIILPSNKKNYINNLKTFLYNNRNNIFSILYCGRVFGELEKYIEKNLKCFFWHENICDAFLEEFDKLLLNENPILLVESEHFEDVHYLKKLFWKCGYRAILISNVKYCYFEDVDMYFEHINSKVLCYAEYYYKSDVILVVLNENKIEIDFDVKVIIKDYCLKKNCEAINISLTKLRKLDIGIIKEIEEIFM